VPSWGTRAEQPLSTFSECLGRSSSGARARKLLIATAVELMLLLLLMVMAPKLATPAHCRQRCRRNAPAGMPGSKP
jgi:hypothetical protein